MLASVLAAALVDDFDYIALLKNAGCAAEALQVARGVGAGLAQLDARSGDARSRAHPDGECVELRRRSSRCASLRGGE
jgi:hypothetical protein